MAHAGPPEPGRRRLEPPAASLRGSRSSAVLLVLAVVATVAVLVVAVVAGGLVDVRVGPPPTEEPSGQAVYGAHETEVPASVEVAQGALTAWADPDLAYPDWWARLRPLLGPGARTAYAGTDPRLLPELELTGQRRVVPGPSPDTATVYLETDGGEFGVDLSRRREGTPWRVLRILFPDQESSLS